MLIPADSVLELAIDHCGEMDAAILWYNYHQIQALGGKTPAQLCKGGNEAAVIAHLNENIGGLL